MTKLALLDTGWRADPPERGAPAGADRRAERNGTRAVQQQLMPVLIHKERLQDKPLVEVVLRMGEDTSVEAFTRQQTALMGRPDSRHAAHQCPTV